MTSNINFRGIPIANAKALNNKITLYKMTAKDEQFAEKLYHSLYLPKLSPGLPHLEYEIWDDVIKRGLFGFLGKDKKSVLAAVNNVPCGIMAFSHDNKTLNLNYISTWPIHPGKKIPLAGKTLFLELFRQFLNTDKQKIELSALKYAPFNPIGKYLSLGFKPCGGDNYQEIMRINKEPAIATFNRLAKLISLKPVKNGLDRDLGEILNTLI